jgi:hypothetical protein
MRRVTLPAGPPLEPGRSRVPLAAPRSARHTGPVTNAHAAELAAMATTLSEVGERLAAMAASYAGERHEALAAALHGAERALRHATRDVERARRLAP